MVAGVHKPLQALVLLDHRAGAATETTVRRSATRRLVFAENYGAFATLGIPAQLDEVAMRSAPGRLAFTEDLPHVIDREMHDGPVDKGSAQFRVRCQVRIGNTSAALAFK